MPFHIGFSRKRCRSFWRARTKPSLYLRREFPYQRQKAIVGRACAEKETFQCRFSLTVQVALMIGLVGPLTTATSDSPKRGALTIFGTQGRHRVNTGERPARVV